MLSLRLTPDMEARLNRMSLETGRSPSVIALEGLREHLDDLEDCALAEARLRKNRKTISLDDVERELGMRGRA